MEVLKFEYFFIPFKEADILLVEKMEIIVLLQLKTEKFCQRQRFVDVEFGFRTWYLRVVFLNFQ